MHTRGFLSPRDGQAAADAYESLGPAAQVVVKEIAKAMAFDAEEYDERVTSDVVATGRDAIFASLLEVTVGTREEYQDWTENYDGEVTEVGTEHVDNAVWHAGPDGRAVAATFQDEEQAAVATLRRQAFGRIYRDLV